jgi:hypothetical protein
MNVAQQHKKPEVSPATTPETTTSGVPVGKIETETDTWEDDMDKKHDDAMVVESPFSQVVRAIATMVETDRPILGSIQKVMADTMPKEHDGAQVMVKKLERFRVAAERAASVAQETFYARFH